MKTLVLSVLVGVLTSGCNYDTGECYPRDEQGAGSGGVITPGGPGGFGDVPPEPQTAGESADPCSGQTAECTVRWKAGSDTCKSQGTAGTCTTLYQGQHATLDQAKEKCEKTYGVGKSEAESCGSCKWETSANNDCLDHCKDLCVEIWEACYDGCGKDHVCKEKCMQKLIACNDKCEEKCK